MPTLLLFFLLFSGSLLAAPLKFSTVRILVEDPEDTVSFSAIEPAPLEQRPSAVSVSEAKVVSDVDLSRVESQSLTATERTTTPVYPQGAPILIAPLAPARPSATPLPDAGFYPLPPQPEVRQYGDSPKLPTAQAVPTPLALDDKLVPTAPAVPFPDSSKASVYYSDAESGALLDIAKLPDQPFSPPVVGALW